MRSMSGVRKNFLRWYCSLSKSERRFLRSIGKKAVSCCLFLVTETDRKALVKPRLKKIKAVKIAVVAQIKKSRHTQGSSETFVGDEER